MVASLPDHTEVKSPRTGAGDARTIRWALTSQPAHAEASEGTPLARETELLSELLRCVLAEQCGERFAADLDWLHTAAADLRAGDQAAGAALMRRLRELPTAEMEPYIRACSLQLQLANIAEERERIRRRRTYDAPGTRQRESLADTAAHLHSRGVARRRRVRALHIELVLTAHPTEATRRSILDHQWDLLELLDRLDDPRTGSSRRRALLDDARTILTIWWQTDDVRRARPRVEDEVRRNLFFFERLFDAVPETFAELERTLATRVELPVISFGSWAGSDMDGHPEVGADTLARTLQLHRETALRLLRDRVRALARRYSHADRRVPLTPALEESLARDEAGAPDRRRAAPHPPRVGAAAHQARLRRAPADQHALRPRHREPDYASPDELRADLALVRECLGSEHVASGAIRRLLWQVDVFGFHLASLDVRQSSSVLREAASALLPGFARAEEEPERITLLSEAVDAGRRGLELAPDGAAGELVRVLDTVALADGGYGREAVPTLVISMVERPSDVLAALWLARRAGIGTARGSGPRLRLVPLFETLADLAGRAGDDGDALRLRPVPRRPAHARRPPDGDARLLGLGQGHGLRVQPVGAARRAGAAVRAGRRARARARALPRPRRLDLARRRPRLRGHPRAAAALGPRPDPHHRAGRDGVGALRASRSSRCARSSRRPRRC